MPDTTPTEAGIPPGVVDALRFIKKHEPEAVTQAQFAAENPDTPLGVWIAMTERGLIYDNEFDDREGFFCTPKGDKAIRDEDEGVYPKA